MTNATHHDATFNIYYKSSAVQMQASDNLSTVEFIRSFFGLVHVFNVQCVKGLAHF